MTLRKTIFTGITTCFLLFGLETGVAFAMSDFDYGDMAKHTYAPNIVRKNFEMEPIEFAFDGLTGGESVELAIKDFRVETYNPETSYYLPKIYSLVPFISNKATKAGVVLKDGKLVVTGSEDGVRVDLEALEKEFYARINNLDTSPIHVKYELVPPRITTADLNEFLPRLNETVATNLTLEAKADETSNKQGWQYTFKVKDNFDMIEPMLSYYFEIGGKKIPISLTRDDKLAGSLLKKDWILNINKQELDKYIQTNLSADLEIPSSDVTISYDEEGGIVFDGSAQNGILVDREELISRMLVAFNSDDQKVKTIEIPLEEVKGVVDVPSELAKRGIKELVSVGYSNFRGSSWKRIQNIKIGLGTYDGLIIPKDDVFSFNEHLGPVDETSGYFKELVIKGDETIPEYGGGLCQVSSTFYRAGLFGGLGIAERAAHSYAVSYYARPGGHGLDCTIYPGVKDCKILNDTPGDILIQAYTDGNDAYFKFYGTKDSRKVALDGPYYSNQQSAPATKIIYDSNYQEGYEKVKDQAHNGFDALWYRTVTQADGTENTETFKSHYQARPKIILRGGTDPSASEYGG